MMIRPAHIVMMVIVSAIILSSMFIIENVFTNHHNASIHKYDLQFQEIESAFQDENYDRVFILSDLILQEEKPGQNEIRAKCYIGLSKLKTGRPNDAIQILQYLINTYPGVKMVYNEQYSANSEESLSFLFTSILTDYVPRYDAATSGMTLSDILSTMDYFDWIKVISLLIGSAVVYEKLVRGGKQESKMPRTD